MDYTGSVSTLINALRPTTTINFQLRRLSNKEILYIQLYKSTNFEFELYYTDPNFDNKVNRYIEDCDLFLDQFEETYHVISFHII